MWNSIKKKLIAWSKYFWLIWYTLMAIPFVHNSVNTNDFLLILILVGVGLTKFFILYMINSKNKLSENMNLIFSFIWFVIYVAVAYPNLRGSDAYSYYLGFLIIIPISTLPLLVHFFLFKKIVD